jgi:hypothetical protein
MTDDEIERLLRRYQPAAPALSLRVRVVAPAAIRRRRAWPWAVAAAAMLALITTLQMGSAKLLLDTTEAVRPVVRTEEADALEAMLGDTEDPHGTANQMIERRNLDRALEEPVAPVGTSGASR